MKKDYSDWKKITYFKCPCCTSAQVITEPGDGDYYDGCKYICLSCFCFFYIPTSGDLFPREIDAVKKRWTEDTNGQG